VPFLKDNDPCWMSESSGFQHQKNVREEGTVSEIVPQLWLWLQVEVTLRPFFVRELAEVII
jgi:hypothetical protein